MNEKCVACSKEGLEKDVIALNKKLLGKKIERCYCMDCLADFLNVSVQDLLDKIEEFKDEGCELFK